MIEVSLMRQKYNILVNFSFCQRKINTLLHLLQHYHFFDPELFYSQILFQFMAKG